MDTKALVEKIKTYQKQLLEGKGFAKTIKVEETKNVDKSLYWALLLRTPDNTKRAGVLPNTNIENIFKFEIPKWFKKIVSPYEKEIPKGYYIGGINYRQLTVEDLPLQDAMTAGVLDLIFAIQHYLNLQITPANYPIDDLNRNTTQFLNALLDETGEFIQSLNIYKWWKKAEIAEKDINNLRLEIVDILHFYLSVILKIFRHKAIKLEAFGINPDANWIRQLLELNSDPQKLEATEYKPNDKDITQIVEDTYHIGWFLQLWKMAGVPNLSQTLLASFAIVSQLFGRIDGVINAVYAQAKRDNNTEILTQIEAIAKKTNPIIKANKAIILLYSKQLAEYAKQYPNLYKQLELTKSAYKNAVSEQIQTVVKGILELEEIHKVVYTEATKLEQGQGLTPAVMEFFKAKVPSVAQKFEETPPVNGSQLYTEVMNSPEVAMMVINGLLSIFALGNLLWAEFTHLLMLYLLKVRLNILRQKLGYKTGEYQKITNGKEDNEYIIDEWTKMVENYDPNYDLLLQLFKVAGVSYNPTITIDKIHIKEINPLRHIPKHLVDMFIKVPQLAYQLLPREILAMLTNDNKAVEIFLDIKFPIALEHITNAEKQILSNLPLNP